LSLVKKSLSPQKAKGGTTPKGGKVAAPPKDLGPKPKGPLSGYIFFSGEYTALLRKDDPNTKATEFMKLAGAKWGTMSDKEKAKYEALKQKDIIRFEK
jgi:hypothetical protein